MADNGVEQRRKRPDSIIRIDFPFRILNWPVNRSESAVMSEHSQSHSSGHHDHEHDDDHHHGHHGGHHHALPDASEMGQAFLWAIALNVLFVVAEFGWGIWAQSTALMADAGHNLSDVLGLVLAYGAARLGLRAATRRYTYGWRSGTILAALGNAILLLLACGVIAWEAVQRLQAPPVVASLTVMIVAAAGIVVNGVSAWLFMSGRQSDMNVRGAYLHMLADAAVSVGVVLAGAVMWWTHWYWVDAAISLVIVVVIVMGTWSLLRGSLRLALHGVPDEVDLEEIEAALRTMHGVTDVHDLHVWALSTTECALTAHLVMPQGHPGDAYLKTASQLLKDRFRVAHATLQIELSVSPHGCECALSNHSPHEKT